MIFKKITKNLNVNSNLNSNIDVNIMRDNSSSSLGVELLMNKSKHPQRLIEEFKPSDPAVFSDNKPRTHRC